MGLNYNLFEEDLVKFEKKRLSTYLLYKKQIFLVGLILAFILRASFGPSTYTNYNGDWLETNYWVDIVFNFLYLSILIIIIRYARIFAFRRLLQKNPILLGNRKVEILNNKLIVYVNEIRSEYHRSAFIRVENDENYIYLFLSKDIGIIIPIARISDKTQIEELESFINNTIH